MVCACLAMLPPACALSRGIKGSALWRLRGGDAIDDGGADGGGRLSHEDIEAKLNRVPTFCLVNADDQFVRMPGKDSIEEVIFFIDAAEAIEALELNRAGNPEAELRLATLPLGAAFTACGGWPDEPPRGAHYVLRGARAAVTAKGDEARAQLKAMGLNAMAESEWVLPCEDGVRTTSPCPLPTCASRLPFTQASDDRALLPQAVHVRRIPNATDDAVILLRGRLRGRLGACWPPARRGAFPGAYGDGLARPRSEYGSLRRHAMGALHAGRVRGLIRACAADCARGGGAADGRGRMTLWRDDVQGWQSYRSRTAWMRWTVSETSTVAREAGQAHPRSSSRDACHTAASALPVTAVSPDPRVRYACVKKSLQLW